MYMVDVIEILKRVKNASYGLAGYDTYSKNAMLNAVAAALSERENIDAILKENGKDVALAHKNGKDGTFIDRLTLTEDRVTGMIDGLRKVADLPDPVGETVEERTLDNGLNIRRVRAPLGVVGIIYEARPNVTVDAASLCLKSGNGVILRGSKDALNTNRAIYSVMRAAILALGFNADVIGFIDDASREAAKEMLAHEEYIDVVIPRGGEGLKNFVLENARMPVIASAGGNCHIYVDKSARQDIATEIAVNAKCQRPSTCNAAEHLLIDRTIAAEFLPKVCAALFAQNVELLGDGECIKIVSNLVPMTDEDRATEFLGYKMTVSIVDGVEEAVSVINRFGTKHSEAIIGEDERATGYFTKYVDAAAVYVNASTRFTDGYEFGLGAEMGISTQKLHVRGPVALRELTSVKYVILGNGQIRR